MTKKVKIKLSNGNLYEGEVKKGIPHGQGILKGMGYYKRSKYWKYDKEEENSFKYIGSFENGKKNGYGVLTTYINYDKYYKRFPHVVRTNYMKKTLTGKKITSKYEGEWKNNNKHGQGKSWSPPSKIEGMPERPPTIHIGKWQNDKHHGKGKRQFGIADFKETLTGTWNKGKIYEGTWICQNKEQYLEYKGFTSSNQPHGKGVLKKIDKKLKIYCLVKGTFFLTQPTKKCSIIYYKDKSFSSVILREEGIFGYGYLHGRGKITNQNGDQYFDIFKFGNMQGKGKKINLNKIKDDYEKIRKLDNKSWNRYYKNREI